MESLRVRRIAIYGSECTGKTTLASILGAKYKAIWVPEYSREYAQKKTNLDVTDVIPIMKGQICAEESAIQQAYANHNALIICDTIPLSSIVYSLYYNQTVPSDAEDLAQRFYDLYLFTNYDVPWEEDGIRGAHVDRPLMHGLFKGALEQRGLSYTLLTGSFEDRQRIAEAAINQLINIH